MLPGATVEIIDSAPPPSSLDDTGTAFIIGLAAKGEDTGPLSTSDLVTSLTAWEDKFGTVQSYNGYEYAAVQGFFAEGGSRLYFSRIVGPSAVDATITVPASSTQYNVTAKGAGAWANGITFAITSGVATITYGSEVEVTPTLTTVGDLKDWLEANSNLVRLASIAVAESAALSNSAARTLASGADDRASITATEQQTALDRFGSNLGPGQVAAPGLTTDAIYGKLATHAVNHNRFAYADGVNSSSVSTVVTAAGTIQALGREKARHIQVLDGWVTVPGLTAGVTRVAPPSAIMLGLAARIDAAGNPNVAVAGPNARSRFALGVAQTRTDADRESLADAGVTAIIVKGAFVQPYDDVVPVDADTDPEWVGAAGNRLVMAIVADALEIAEAHMFGGVSGPADLDAFAGDLKGMLAGWFSLGALYSSDGSAAGAFRVETGPSVNTPETLAARQLKAALALKISPNARQVNITITNTPLTGAV